MCEKNVKVHTIFTFFSLYYEIIYTLIDRTMKITLVSLVLMIAIVVIEIVVIAITAWIILNPKVVLQTTVIPVAM